MVVLLVECPKCSKKQKTTSVVSKQCIGCRRSFNITSKREGSRVVKILEGTRSQFFNELYKKRVYKGRLSY